jgi:hypothetical protein
LVEDGGDTVKDDAADPEALAEEPPSLDARDVTLLTTVLYDRWMPSELFEHVCAAIRDPRIAEQARKLYAGRIP